MDNPKPFETFRPARVLIPLGLAIALSLFGDLTLYAVLVTQLDAVGLSLAAVGLMLGANRLIRIPGNPLAGLLFDRFGRRRLFLLGMALGVGSTAGYALVQGFWPFLAMRLTWGIAWTLINIGGLSMVVDVSTPADRGRLTGLYNTWVLAGLGLGPLVGATLVDAFGFRAGMLSCAAISAAGLLIAVLALPETRSGGSAARTRPSEARPTQGQRWWRQFKALLSATPGLSTTALLYLIAMFAGEGIVLSTLSLLLQQRFGDQIPVGSVAMGVGTLAGLLLGMRALLAGLTAPLAGQWSDRRARRWPVIGASLVVGILGFAVLAIAQEPPAIVVGVALSALSAGAALAVLTAQVGDLAPPGRQGVVMGGYATMGDIGSALGPLVAYALVLVVDLRWVLVFCALTFAAGLGLMQKAPPPGARDSSS